MKNDSKKAPKSPSVKGDRLENKDTKNTDKKAASQNDIGEHEFEEDRSMEIRMKKQPFHKNEPTPPNRETDGI